jgi:ATP-binding cassette subfamily E protein 1
VTVQVIRELLGREGEGHVQRYVIVVEHDLSVLDYLSDFICCLYGKPGAYGVVTLPFSVREGINIFLAGGPIEDVALHGYMDCISAM